MKQALLILAAAAMLAGLILVGESGILDIAFSSDVSTDVSQIPVESESVVSGSTPNDSSPSAPASAGPSAPQAPVSSSSSSSSASSEPQPQKIDPNDDWRLMLVNADHLLPEDYTFEKVVIEDNFTFDARAAQALTEMLEAGRAAGYSLRIVSTYRTVERSDYLYTSKVSEYQALGYSEEDAAVEAARWVAPPRQSEHNAGLAIDVVSRDYDQVYGDLMHEFEDFPAFTWLSEHCAEFGFILRYPEDKPEITGITYEPWHYRYVGVEHAQKMQELDLCLEEYWDYLLEQ